MNAGQRPALPQDYTPKYACLTVSLSRISAAVPDSIATHPRPVPLMTGMSRRLSVGIYTLDGRRVTGRGPGYSPVAGHAGASVRSLPWCLAWAAA